ncbi:MAG: NIF family HAD-type phosphatase [Pseudomonadota bacterium]
MPHPPFLVRYRLPRPVSRAFEAVLCTASPEEPPHLARWCAGVALHFVAAVRQGLLLAQDPARAVKAPGRHDLWAEVDSPLAARLAGPPPHGLLRYAGDYGGEPPPDPVPGLLRAFGALIHWAPFRIVVPTRAGLTVLLGPRLEIGLPWRPTAELLERFPPGTPLLVDPTDGLALSLAPLLAWEKDPRQPFGHLLVLRRVAGGVGQYREEGLRGCPGRALPLLGHPREEVLPLPPAVLSALAAPPARFADGRSVPGYQVEGLIWRGGTSDVYLARREVDGAEVALKTHEDDPGFFDENYRRFLDEERIAEAIHHPRVVRPLGVRVEGFGLVHEQPFIPRGSLEDLLEAHGVLPAVQAAALCDQVLDALEAVHAAGVAHNDLKPDNLLFDAAGNLHLIDFGIARPLGGRRPELRPGAPPGSLGYTAPELLRGEPPGVASDLFAVGVILARMVSGGLPQGPAEARATRGIPGPLRGFLDRCLALDPARRFQSAAHARRRLVPAAAALLPERAVSLDLEGTLVTDWGGRHPRAGLCDFLQFCLDFFERVFIYTLLSEEKARELIADLCARGLAPAELPARMEVVDWPRGQDGASKDLRRCRVPIEQNVIVDDTEAVVPADQRHRWIQVPPYDDPDRPDPGLDDLPVRLQRLFGWCR